MKKILICAMAVLGVGACSMHDAQAIFRKKPTQSMNAGTRAVYSVYDSESLNNVLAEFGKAKTYLEQIKNKYTELLLEKNGGVKLDRATQAKLNAVMKNDLLILSTMEECAQWAVSGATAKDLANISKKLTALQKKNLISLSVVELVGPELGGMGGVIAHNGVLNVRDILNAWESGNGSLEGAENALNACYNYLDQVKGDKAIHAAGVDKWMEALKRRIASRDGVVTPGLVERCADVLNKYIAVAKTIDAAQRKSDGLEAKKQELQQLVDLFSQCIGNAQIRKKGQNADAQQDVEAFRSYLYSLQVSLSGHHADAEFNSDASVRRDGPSARYRAFGAASQDDNFVGDAVDAPSREVVSSWKPYDKERVAAIRAQKEIGAAQSPVSDMESAGEETAAPAAGKKRLGDKLKGLFSKKSKK